MRIGHLEHRSYYSHIISSFEEISLGVLQIFGQDFFEKLCREGKKVRGAKGMVFPESVFDEVTRSYWPADHPQ